MDPAGSGRRLQLVDDLAAAEPGESGLSVKQAAAFVVLVGGIFVSELGRTRAFS